MSGPPRPGDSSGTFASALGCTVGHRGSPKWVPESDALGSLARPFGSVYYVTGTPSMVVGTLGRSGI